MKKSLLTLLFCGLLLFSVETVHAQNSENSGLGVGAVINNPSGLSAKYWLSDNIAVDAAFSFSLSDNFSDVYLHSDVLKHTDTINSEALELYYGMGLRLLWGDIYNDVNAGLRWPVGTEYSFADTKIKSFIELAPTLDFAPDARFFFGGAVGMRIYLN
ncbi:hypothetical protein [Fodinibius sp.]|uniref:hypothetical protein n=1 Tax=Fodinibius sp. TaxID=1872440 RepID=UPI002ACEBF89|nr:hypothetical protein [Fodinibius sp.]MDZ7659302.1 hypothetical protein [Fodinibius sp.]